MPVRSPPRSGHRSARPSGSPLVRLACASRLRWRAVAQRIALVTGGARGIGRAIAEALIAAGCSVAAADLEGSDVTMDVTDPESVRNGIAEVEGELGPID